MWHTVYHIKLTITHNTLTTTYNTSLPIHNSKITSSHPTPITSPHPKKDCKENIYLYVFLANFWQKFYDVIANRCLIPAFYVFVNETNDHEPKLCCGMYTAMIKDVVLLPCDYSLSLTSVISRLFSAFLNYMSIQILISIKKGKALICRLRFSSCSVGIYRVLWRALIRGLW